MHGNTGLRQSLAGVFDVAVLLRSPRWAALTLYRFWAFAGMTKRRVYRRVRFEANDPLACRAVVPGLIAGPG